MNRLFAFLLLTSTVLFAGCAPRLSDFVNGSRFSNFVTVSGDRLMDGEDEVRFISFNIPNLHYVEDDMRFEQTLPFRLPTEFEIRDALTAVRQMGGTVVRTYTLSVRKPDDPPGMPRHIVGPGQFNEEAFVALDQVLAIANELGIRVIIPLVDNWWWWGGIQEYAQFRGEEKEAFWKDRVLIGDFKQTIAYVINRRNTITGKRYRDDKAILAWETGNELESPYAWVAEIAAYIKRQDPNHLVIDGIHSREIRPEALTDPNIDIVSTHHYTPPAEMLDEVTRNIEVAAGKKPFFVGEFGFIPTPDIEKVLDAVIQGGASGALIWSLRPRSRDGGFYWHYEYNGFHAYHWPGFASGAGYDEEAVVRLLHEKAFKIRGEKIPKLKKPDTPHLLPIEVPSAISWQGSAGATSYIVERAPEAKGPWEVLAEGVSDAVVPYQPLFADTLTEIGQAYFYRVRAVNDAGRSKASNEVGPVSVTRRFLIDELANFSRLHTHQGFAAVTADDYRDVKFERTRVEGEAGASLVYRVPGRIEEVKVFTFLPDPAEAVSFAISMDGAGYEPVALAATDYSSKPDDAMHPVLYQQEMLNAEASFLKVMLEKKGQISRVEIYYVP